jgi:hypothetical protein
VLECASTSLLPSHRRRMCLCRALQASLSKYNPPTLDRAISTKDRFRHAALVSAASAAAVAPCNRAAQPRAEDAAAPTLPGATP